MSRLVLRWIGLAVFAITLSVAFVNLGYWQLDRLDQRRNRNESVLSHESAPVVPFETVFTRPITDSDQWQRVTATGTFDADHQFVVRYRAHAGSTGFEVVTPLRTPFGAVLVDRGFASRPPGQDFPKVAPLPPPGTVTVIGYVRRNEQASADAMTPVEGQMRSINSEALAGALPYPVRSGYIGAITVAPGVNTGLAPVHPPELSEGSHLSYALQWFLFAGMAGLAMIVLIRGDLRDRRKAAAKLARAAALTQVPSHDNAP
jgi:cytochrome oxidase assembly protein ShyY1